MPLFNNIYHGRRVLITGHTGFKGSWLALWLDALGADITGIALEPETKPNHWEILNLKINDFRQDIRDAQKIREIIHDIKPEIVFHLAAQPLVRYSYQEPLLTWESNVMGTANILNACRDLRELKAIVAITTDKCYENKEWVWGYRENDRLGGHDPYSASKAACELVAASFRNSFFNTDTSPLLATARAGNVIGGGDWSLDRLIPDLVRAVSNNEKLKIRSPKATRPWQHVLESLTGYLQLGQKLFERNPAFAEGWNFGPDILGNRTVEEVLTGMQNHWNGFDWEMSADFNPHEANLLYLDSTKARTKLGWRPIWSFDETLEKTASWYRSYLENGIVESKNQLEDYINRLSAVAGAEC